MKALNPIHKIVARELALGFLLSAICEARNLDTTNWKRIANSTLFKTEVKRIGDKLEQQEIEAYHENPAMQKLKAAQIRAVDTLTIELDNYDKDSGASAMSRIKSANSVIEKSGLVQVEQTAPVTIIQISSNKQDILTTKTSLNRMPEHISGVPALGI